MRTRKTLAVDFDGVISNYTGWKGKGVFAEPVDGCKESLCFLKSEGWTIIINTTRLEIHQVKDYLDKHSIPYDHINFNPENIKQMCSPSKVLADVYLDDRSVRFDGNWNKAVADVVSAIEWWRKE